MLLRPPKSSESRARISLDDLLQAFVWSGIVLELRSAIRAVPLGRQAVQEGRSATSHPASDESPHPSKGKLHLDSGPSYDEEGFLRLFSSPGRHREDWVRERCRTAREVRTRVSATVHPRCPLHGPQYKRASAAAVVIHCIETARRRYRPSAQP